MKNQYLIIVIILLSTTVFPQSGMVASLYNSGKISGKIVDAEEGSPLPSANITLHNQNDSAFAGGISSGPDGEFTLKNLNEGRYYLKISYVGYSNKIIPNIALSREHGEFKAGIVKMGKNTVTLQEAKVIGEKAAEELRLDKKVINVGQNINASGGTALDVLRDQPSVRVDPDGTVYLRGSSDFKVLINGKPSVLQGSDALRQLSANMIDNIEIITNPSAKYDAEGSAGIININLKKQKEYSLSGIANLNSGSRDKYNGDFSVNYNVNDLNVSGGVDYRNNSNFNDQGVERSSFSPSGDIYNSTKLSIKDHRKQYSGRAGIDYTFNEKNSMSLSLGGGEVDVFTAINSSVKNTGQSALDFAFNENNYETPVKYFNSSLNYDHKFSPGVSGISFEVTYSNISLPGIRNSAEFVTDASYISRNADPLKTKFENDAVRNEGRVKLNFNQKINEQSTFELGVQSNLSYRNFNIENMLFDWNSDAYVADSGLTNKFDFKNNVYAAFATYSSSLFDFNYMLGIRAEYNDRLLDQKTLNGSFKFNKTDYFPSLNISRKIGDHQLQFSYSRRINRPNENLLNPFPFYNDTYLTSAGNPDLLPEYINSFELNYQKMFGSIFFSVQTYYRNSDNGVQQTFKVEPNGKLLTTFENFAKTDTYGSEISSSFNVAEIFKFDPGINLYGSSFNGNIVGMNINKDIFNWTARLNTTVIIDPDTRLQFGGNYFGKINQPQIEIRPFFILNASLKRDFFDKKLSLTLQARNILTTSNLDIISNGTNFNSSIFVHGEVPVISLMIGYNFNNFKKSRTGSDNIDIRSGL